jgi:hypothetical protein
MMLPINYVFLVRFEVLWWNVREIDHLEYLGVEGTIILKWIFIKKNGGHGIDWSDSG